MRILVIMMLMVMGCMSEAEKLEEENRRIEARREQFKRAKKVDAERAVKDAGGKWIGEDGRIYDLTALDYDGNMTSLIMPTRKIMFVTYRGYDPVGDSKVAVLPVGLRRAEGYWFAIPSNVRNKYLLIWKELNPQDGVMVLKDRDLKLTASGVWLIDTETGQRFKRAKD